MKAGHEPVVSACSPEGQLDCIKREVASKVKELIVSLCSALMRPCLDYYIQALCPQQKKDIKLLEKIQGKAIKSLKRLFSFVNTLVHRVTCAKSLHIPRLHFFVSNLKIIVTVVKIK